MDKTYLRDKRLQSALVKFSETQADSNKVIESLLDCIFSVNQSSPAPANEHLHASSAA